MLPSTLCFTVASTRGRSGITRAVALQQHQLSMQDGALCVHDVRAGKQPCQRHSLLQHNEAAPDIAAASWRPGSNGNTAYCAQGRSVHVLDLRMSTSSRCAAVDDSPVCVDAGNGSARKALSHGRAAEHVQTKPVLSQASPSTASQEAARCVLRSLRYNRDNVSCLAVNEKGALLVAGDDSGEGRYAAPGSEGA